MFLTIVFAILFVLLIIRIGKAIRRRLYDPIGKARRIIEARKD